MKKKKASTKKETIFVSIASYRDKELIPTLDNMIKQAHNPENLKICVCWQHDEDEDLSKYEKDSRFLIIDVPYQEAKGVCWARNLIQKQFFMPKNNSLKYRGTIILIFLRHWHKKANTYHMPNCFWSYQHRSIQVLWQRS